MVTVIIPTYNNQETICRAIDSILNQEYRAIEVLIIDNGSSDNTVDLINKYAINNKNIHLLISKRGRSCARNLGLSYAKGKYIQFLDADDELESKKIAEAISFLGENKKVKAYISGVSYRNDITHKTKINLINEGKKYELLLGNIYPINAPIIRNVNIISFDESLSFNEDWLFWVQNIYGSCIKYASNIGIPNNNLAIVHITGQNTSKNYQVMKLYKVYVRAKVRGIVKYTNLHTLIADCKLLLQYSVIYDDTFKYDEIIRHTFKNELLVINFILRSKTIRDSIRVKEIRKSKDNIYNS